MSRLDAPTLECRLDVFMRNHANVCTYSLKDIALWKSRDSGETVAEDGQTASGDGVVSKDVGT